METEIFAFIVLGNFVGGGAQEGVGEDSCEGGEGEGGDSECVGEDEVVWQCGVDKVDK